MKTSMRYLAVVFAVAMMLCALTVSAATFADIKSDTPHAKAIESLTSLGVLHGYEDGTFKPDLPVRRDEMAKLVYTTFTASTDAGDGVVTFPDVPANSWAKGYISWCAGKNIVGGYEDGTFKPEGNVTYDEALKMLCAMLGYTDFKPGMWPVDVRLKALIDLNLGEELADLAGDAVLTRAQVAQLFQNSLDEQMYIEPAEETKVGGLTVLAPTKAPSTIAKDVWGYTELDVRIVGTESYNLKAAYAVMEGTTTGSGGPEILAGGSSTTVPSSSVLYVTYPKSGNGDELVVAYLDKDGKFVADRVEVPAEGETPASYYYEPKYLTIKLDDIKLDEYEGKTDDLFARDIKLFINKDGEYFSSTLKGRVAEGIAGGTIATTGFAESELSYTHGGNKYNTKYAIHGMKIDGIEYRSEKFYNLRNLVFCPGGEVLATSTYGGAHLSGYVYVDDNMNLINLLYYHGNTSDGSASPDKDYTYNFPSALYLSGNHSSSRKGIDSDGDGYYDYVSIAYNKPYVVTASTKTSITLQSLDDTKYVVTYKGDNFCTEIDRPKTDDIIVGYFIGDKFYHTSTAKTITAFATKYTAGDSSSTVVLYGYGTYSTVTNLHTKRYLNQANTVLKSLVTSINKESTFVGYDVDKAKYNYVTYYIYNDKIIGARLATADEIKNAAGGQNKAILQFVDKPTELQLNEKTKKYEIFYPAYLLINGKEELVNLKPTDAINGTEAATVAQDGSMYRAYLDKEDNTTVMYPNILVEFEVDSKGYYSLKTITAEKDEITDTNAVIAGSEKVGDTLISKGNKLVINSDIGIMSIVDKGGKEIIPGAKIVANGSSVIYYTYTLKTTGNHEYVDFCLGTEIPKEFDPVEIVGDTYLSYDKEEGLWVLDTTMIAEDGFAGVAVTDDKSNYKNDARYHLLSLADSEAEYVADKKDVFMTYNFKGIYEGTEISGPNTDIEYKDAKAAELGKIYAWDADKKVENYIEIAGNEEVECYFEEVIEHVLVDLNLVFTDKTPDGYVTDETTKILAIKNVPNENNEEYVYEEISLAEIDTLFETVEEYKANTSKTHKIGAKIGTYEEDKATKIAYIIIDWFEYNEELEAYTIAGEIVE